MKEISELIERLKNESGSRNLDWYIECRFGPGSVDEAKERNAKLGLTEPRICGPGQWDIDYPAYTTSFDHASGFCEEVTKSREQLVSVYKAALDLWLADEPVDHRKFPKYICLATLRSVEASNAD